MSCFCVQSMLENTGLGKKDAGNITGTNADLRKLSMKESARILKNYGATETEIKGATDRLQCPWRSLKSVG